MLSDMGATSGGGWDIYVGLGGPRSRSELESLSGLEDAHSPSCHCVLMAMVCVSLHVLRSPV